MSSNVSDLTIEGHETFKTNHIDKHRINNNVNISITKLYYVNEKSYLYFEVQKTLIIYAW